MKTTWPKNPGWRPVDHPQSKTLIERIVTGHDYGVRFEQWDGAGIVEEAKIGATGHGVETDSMILATGGLTPEYLEAQRIRREIVEAAAADET